MISLVIIDKKGSLKTEKIKTMDIEELYKKAKLRKKDNFKKRNTWKTDKYWVSIYAKKDGRAGSENKYELPPPIDKDLYFGVMVVVKHKNKIPKNEEVVNFTKEEWLKVYEKCMGGFEDLGDTSEEEEEEEIPAHLRTKAGYMKDGFVVDDDSDGDDDDNNDDDDDDSDDDDVDVDVDVDVDDDDDVDVDDVDVDVAKGGDKDEEENNLDILEDIGSELSEEDYDYK
jgi:hypothetical protein